jgi:ribosomal protein L25 (general stress protein Ctc)
MEFRAIRRPDGVAAVVYVREESPSCGMLHASPLSYECEAVAEEHNREREAREALRAAGQMELL